ncbi:hypothetical protein P3L10_001161 [Capsicum annuum]
MVDAFGWVLFLNAVGDFVKFKVSTPSIMLVWQRDILNARTPPRVTCKHHEYDQDQIEPNDAWYRMENELVQRSFFFGEEEIEAIRNQVSPIHCSSGRFELLTSYLWKNRTIALDLNPEETVALACPVTGSGRLEKLKIPQGYYGNAFAFASVISKAGLVGTNPLTYCLELVKKAKNQVNEEYFSSLPDLNVIKGKPYPIVTWSFVLSNSFHVGFDKVDFGWGEPKYGGMAKAHSCLSYFVPSKISKGQEGILTPISLPPRAMERFENAIYKLTSNVVKALKKVPKI